MDYSIETLRELEETLEDYPVSEECRANLVNGALQTVCGIIRTNWDPSAIRDAIEKEAFYRQSLRDDLSIDDPLYDLFRILFVCSTEDLPLMIDSDFRWLIEWRLRTTQEYCPPEKTA